MINGIKEACESLGITLFVTNKDDGKEPVLNRITKIEDLPIMLISWDIETTVSFDQYGMLESPPSNIVCLLMSKAYEATREEYQETAEKMGLLFIRFLKKLHEILMRNHSESSQPITNASYKRVPVWGAGKHSGALGKFTMVNNIKPC